MEFAGGGRYDDPEGAYRVLYLAETVKACYVESLANQRPALSALAKREALPPGDPGDRDLRPGEIPRAFLRAWCEERALGSILLEPGQDWLDMFAAETHRELRVELAGQLNEMGADDYDLGDAVGRSRRVSRAVSRWAHEHGFRGIVYPSRFHYELRCWALFESAKSVRLSVVPVYPDSPDLEAALAFHGLAVVE